MRFGPSYDIPLILSRNAVRCRSHTVQALNNLQLISSALILRERPGAR